MKHWQHGIVNYPIALDRCRSRRKAVRWCNGDARGLGVGYSWAATLVKWSPEFICEPARAYIGTRYEDAAG
jgi:hypothetical protein